MNVERIRLRRATHPAALALLIAFASGCRKQEAPSFERPPAPVVVATATAVDVPVYLDQIGKCVAREMVSIRPQVSGRITQIHFEDGADLKVGDLLFTIDPRPFQAQLDAAEARLIQARASLELAKAEFVRVESLVNTKAIAQIDFDTRKNAVDVGEAQVKQSAADVDTAGLNLEYCTIRSPIDGRAGQRMVDVGNVVSAMNIGVNATPMLTIQRLDPMYVEFTVTENDLTNVQESIAKGPVKVEVRLPDDMANARVGDLTFLDNAVQEATGTVKMRATIANDDHRFWPSRFVKVRLILSTIPNAVLVPAQAPQVSANGQSVFVVKDDSTAELRPVTLGQRHGDLVAIRQGVAAGERVVVAGQIGVTPGGKVRITQGPEANLAAGLPKGNGQPTDRNQ